MRTNEFYIKRPIRAHVISMDKWDYQDRACLFLFMKRFYTLKNTYKQKQANKTQRSQKKPNKILTSKKQTNKTKIREQKTTKAAIF